MAIERGRLPSEIKQSLSMRFAAIGGNPKVAAVHREPTDMSNDAAKLTGLAIAWFVIFGADADVLPAVPLGILVGVLATIFVSVAQLLRPGWA
jgi:hypothetical protein